jgi:hypothetical protein
MKLPNKGVSRLTHHSGTRSLIRFNARLEDLLWLGPCGQGTSDEVGRRTQARVG